MWLVKSIIAKEVRQPQFNHSSGFTVALHCIELSARFLMWCSLMCCCLRVPSLVRRTQADVVPQAASLDVVRDLFPGKTPFANEVVFRLVLFECVHRWDA